MLEYLIYAILIFLPLGFFMARFLAKQGFAKKQITGFTVAALAAVILFPISAARMGTSSTGIIFIFVLALFSWQIVKTEQLSTNEELSENSQFDPTVLVKREDSNKPTEVAAKETTVMSKQESVNAAEEVAAISRQEIDISEAETADLSEQPTIEVPEEAIDIISEPEMIDASEAEDIGLPEQETADVPKEEAIGIAGPETIDVPETEAVDLPEQPTVDILEEEANKSEPEIDAPDEEDEDLLIKETADVADEEAIDSAEEIIERSEMQITGPGTIDSDIYETVENEGRLQTALTYEAPVKMADDTNDSSECEETGLVEEPVTAEAVAINDFEWEEKPSDADDLTEVPDEREDTDNTPAVNSMIDAGFENKINGNAREAIKCFKAALQLTDSADLKYLLSQELVLHYEILGQYTNAINVLHNIVGSGLVPAAGLDQALQQLEYFNRMIEELERLGIGEVPVSEVPRLVKIKVGQNT